MSTHIFIRYSHQQQVISSTTTILVVVTVKIMCKLYVHAAYMISMTHQGMLAIVLVVVPRSTNG